MSEFSKKWKHTVSIKRFIDPYDTDESHTLMWRFEGIFNELKQFHDYDSWDDIVNTSALDSDVDELFWALEVIHSGALANDVEKFDDGLNMLYDWADERWVWMGAVI